MSLTILNYLSGNYLLAQQNESQIITIEYPSHFYQTCFKFLNFQIYNHLNQTRPLLIVDLDGHFHPQYLQVESIIKSTTNTITICQQWGNVMSLIESTLTKLHSLEILVRGCELSWELSTQYILEIAAKYANVQITVLLPNDIPNKHQQLIQNAATCRLQIDRLMEIEDKVVVGGQEFRLYDILTTMVITKSNGHSFIKRYLISGKNLHNLRLVVSKYKECPAEEQPDIMAEVQRKVNPSFNLAMTEEQRASKQLLDSQINPYKQIMGLTKTPLIYQQEGDEKQMRVDLEEEDEEYEG